MRVRVKVADRAGRRSHELALARAWRNALWRIGLASAIALVVGWWLHAIAACVLVVATVWLGLGAYRLAELGVGSKAADGRPERPASGLWAELQHVVQRRAPGGVRRKRHLVGLLRAFRDAAAALPDAVVAARQRHSHPLVQRTRRERLLGLSHPHDRGGHVTEPPARAAHRRLAAQRRHRAAERSAVARR